MSFPKNEQNKENIFLSFLKSIQFVTLYRYMEQFQLVKVNNFLWLDNNQFVSQARMPFFKADKLIQKIIVNP